MKPFQIISDSSCDIADVLLKQYNIELIPFYISFDQEKYAKERKEISLSQFYHTLRQEDIFPKTSLPSVQDYMNKFRPYLEQDVDILCFCLSSKFSGSYQAAVTARQILLEEEKLNGNIIIVDSIQATAGQGLVVLEAAKMKEQGLPLEKVAECINQLKETSRIMFTVDTLEYLQKGGRIGKAGALVGTILNVKPILYLQEGELHPYGVMRGRKKAIKKLIAMTAEHIESNSLVEYEFGIAHGNCEEDAILLKSFLKKELNIDIHLPFFEIGTTIGTNTGPDALGICFIKKFG
ncbi:MAG: DegV family protein [Epulopiscium sp.]|nr:DegV family protein [Candidatus Epulonipiscium sp.]